MLRVSRRDARPLLKPAVDPREGHAQTCEDRRRPNDRPHQVVSTIVNMNGIAHNESPAVAAAQAAERRGPSNDRTQARRRHAREHVASVEASPHIVPLEARIEGLANEPSEKDEREQRQESEGVDGAGGCE